MYNQSELIYHYRNMIRKYARITLLMAVVALTSAHCCAAALEFKVMGVGVQTIAERSLRFLLRMASSLALLILVASGIFYMISNGNPENQTKAKRMLVAALEGIVVIALSYSILAFLDMILTKTV
jgi:energy-coupling factor transporter transmembrane protein EcfT